MTEPEALSAARDPSKNEMQVIESGAHDPLAARSSETANVGLETESAHHVVCDSVFSRK
jgi:hypothetical protein